MKVLYYHFSSSYHLKIIELLFQLYSWNPVFISGLNVNKNDLKKKNLFNSCHFIDSKLLRQAKFELDNIGKYIPVDSQVFEKIAPNMINSMGFQIVDDSNGKNYSYQERKSYFYDSINYWNSVLINLKPEIVVFFTRPHTPAEYPLYLLSKNIFDIPTLIINPIPLFNLNYHFIAYSDEAPYKIILKKYKNNKKLMPSDKVKKYIYKIKSNKLTPNYLNNNLNEKPNVLNIFKALGNEIILGIINFNLFKEGWHFIKINQRPYNDIKSRPNRFQYAIAFNLISFKNYLNFKHYNKVAEQPLFKDKKYVYFSASYQPEASTNIQAGFYEDQFQVLDILSYVIPTDWFIYYKEHPSTFSTSFGKRGSLIRSKFYYKRLKKYKNIKLISTEAETYKLIDNSQFVATLGGTVGWESIVRGTPVLSFGDSWYHGCKSIFAIKTIKDAKYAVDKIINGYKPSENEILSYAAALESISYPNLIHRDFEKNIKKVTNPELELERIAKALYNAFRSIS